MSEFRFTPATLSRIRDLVRLNCREVVICTDLGCDLATLRGIARKHGLSLKPIAPDADDGKPDRMLYQRSAWPVMKGGTDE